MKQLIFYSLKVFITFLCIASAGIELEETLHYHSSLDALPSFFFFIYMGFFIFLPSLLILAAAVFVFRYINIKPMITKLGLSILAFGLITSTYLLIIGLRIIKQQFDWAIICSFAFVFSVWLYTLPTINKARKIGSV